MVVPCLSKPENILQKKAILKLILDSVLYFFVAVRKINR